VNITTWWLFVTTETVLCLTPGPAVLFVLSSALRAGARKGAASIAGILSANSVYYVLSATGIGALMIASHDLFFTVKWLGAAYLIYLGLRALLGSKSMLAKVESSPARFSGWRLLGDGFVLQMSNPNSIVFFTALLPQFINPRRAIAPQMAILGVTSVAIEFFVLLGYGLAAERASALARRPRYAAWTNRIAGMLLIGAGAGLATLRRN
jgi:homoserine/homoserine lactone efflux protein